MTSIIIQKALFPDVQTLISIGKETFLDTFAENNTAENINSYVEQNFTEDRIKAEINNPDSHFYIAWEGENAIGYLKLNTGAAQNELQDEASLEIERIYVRSAYLGRKLGQLLYDKALEIAKELSKSYIWLGVWEENPRAIRFYEKNGFVAFDKHIFMMGDDKQTDIMMRKDL